MKADTSREIYALDYAVCYVLITIDEMLRPAKIGWRALGQSFRYEIDNLLSVTRLEMLDKRIRIFPVGWPKESFIYCRIISNGNWWYPEEGVIIARHLPQFDADVSFKFHTGCPSFITPRDSGYPIHEKIREAARNRRPDLVGKPGHDL